MERNFYAKRLFPCWVMASQEPFKDDVGGAALLDAMNAAVARAHFKEVRRNSFLLNRCCRLFTSVTATITTATTTTNT